MNRMTIVHKLGEYFQKKGKYMSIDEYNRETDVPMRAQIVKRVFNSWSRMMTYVKNYYPNIGVVVKAPVVKTAAPKKVVKSTKKVKKDVE